MNDIVGVSVYTLAIPEPTTTELIENLPSSFRNKVSWKLNPRSGKTQPFVFSREKGRTVFEFWVKDWYNDNVPYG